MFKIISCVFSFIHRVTTSRIRHAGLHALKRYLSTTKSLLVKLKELDEKYGPQPLP